MLFQKILYVRAKGETLNLSSSGGKGGGGGGGLNLNSLLSCTKQPHYATMNDSKNDV